MDFFSPDNWNFMSSFWREKKTNCTQKSFAFLARATKPESSPYFLIIFLILSNFTTSYSRKMATPTFAVIR